MLHKQAITALAGIFFGFMALMFSPSADGAGYPNKAIKFIVTAGPGGGEDTEARALAPFLEKHLKQRIIIENQAGAGGKIAFERFQNAKPDGYSLITYTFPKSIIIEVKDKTGFRTKDYTPIYSWSRSSQLLAVHADNWKTLDEFINAAKTKPLSGGVSGDATYLAGLLAMEGMGIKLNWVPYEGAAGSVAALAGKHLDFAVSLATSAAPLIKAGRLRPLLLLSDKRDPFMPDVPIPRDLGIKVDIIASLRGVEAPPKTPPAIIKTLEEAFRRAAQEPDFIEIAKKKQMILQSVDSREFGKIVLDTYPKIEKYGQMLK
jgi:tripartite-type tricarboxylate transporter receptor subunit TctC